MSDKAIDYVEVSDLVPEGALALGMFRIAFYVTPDGAPEASFKDDLESVTFREFIGELEFIKSFYVQRILDEGWPAPDDEEGD